MARRFTVPDNPHSVGSPRIPGPKLLGRGVDGEATYGSDQPRRARLMSVLAKALPLLDPRDEAWGDAVLSALGEHPTKRAEIEAYDLIRRANGVPATNPHQLKDVLKPTGLSAPLYEQRTATITRVAGDPDSTSRIDRQPPTEQFRRAA